MLRCMVVRRLCCLVALGIVACSSAKQHTLTVIGSTTVAPGALVALDDPSGSFQSGATIKGSLGSTSVSLRAWDAHGALVLVPALPAGPAKLHVDGYADLDFTVTQNIAIADPAQYLAQSYSTWTAQADAALSAHPGDPTLTAIRANLSALASLAAGLAPGDQAKLAALLSANPGLLPSPAARLFDFDSFDQAANTLLSDFADYATAVTYGVASAVTADPPGLALSETATALVADKIESDFQDIENQYVFSAFDSIDSELRDLPPPLRLTSGVQKTLSLTEPFHALSSAESTNHDPVVQQLVADADELPSLVGEANQQAPATSYPMPAPLGAPTNQSEPLDPDYVTVTAEDVPSGVNVAVTKSAGGVMVTATLPSCQMLGAQATFTLDLSYQDPVNDPVDTKRQAIVACCDPVGTWTETGTFMNSGAFSDGSCRAGTAAYTSIYQIASDGTVTFSKFFNQAMAGSMKGTIDPTTCSLTIDASATNTTTCGSGQSTESQSIHAKIQFVGDQATTMWTNTATATGMCVTGNCMDQAQGTAMR